MPYRFYEYNCQSTGDPAGAHTFQGEKDTHVRLLRVGTDGTNSRIVVSDGTARDFDVVYIDDYSHQIEVSWATLDGDTPDTITTQSPLALLTNADSGAVASWMTSDGCSPIHYEDRTAHQSWDVSCGGTISKNYWLTTVSGGAVASKAPLNFAGQSARVQPVLQGQNGNFFGTVATQQGSLMVSFDQSGNIQWSVPNDSPQIATADGGVIGASGITYDSSGNVTGQLATLAIESWTGNDYQLGSVESVASAPIKLAESFWAIAGGNASGNGTAIQQVQTNDAQQATEQLPTGPLHCNYNRIELLTSLSPDAIFQNFIQTFDGVRGANNTVVDVNPSVRPVTVGGQTLTFRLHGLFGTQPVMWMGLGQGPFSVGTERFDATAHVISAVTLTGHPLAGWRYWSVYSVGPDDIVIETGAADAPGPGRKNYAGYYLFSGRVLKTWEDYLRYIQRGIGAPLGPPAGSPRNLNVIQGTYDDSKKDYILLNVCQATSCN